MNAHSIPKIRAARTDDAESLAKLIDIAGEGIPHWLWNRQCNPGQEPLDVGVERAQRTSGGFSYINALIAEDTNATLGMVLGYPIHDAPSETSDDVPDPIAPFVALEEKAVGTWYVNALAVFASHRSKGVGTSLLKAAESLADDQGVKTMSIQVYGQNAGAMQLYERSGYHVVAKEPVRLHPCQPYYTGDVLLLFKTIGG